MFVRSKAKSAFDALVCVEGKFKQAPVDGAPFVELVMCYVQTETGTTFGTCPVTHNEALGQTVLSPETLEKFQAFLESAEKDFGKAAFGDGTIEEVRGPTTAETRKGLGGGF